MNIIELAREAWELESLPESEAQELQAFAAAVIKAHEAKLQARSEPVAWRFIDDEDGGHISYSTSAPRPEHIEYLKKWNRPAWEPLFAAPVQQEPVAWLPSAEWTPCCKLPVTVHVRKQREGETHISTREGITPVKPDDLIMRGVQGEEYPIGREIFEHTYHIGEAQKYSGNADFWRDKCKTLEAQNKALLGELKRIATFDYKLRPTPEDLRDVASAAIALVEWQ